MSRGILSLAFASTLRLAIVCGLVVLIVLIVRRISQRRFAHALWLGLVPFALALGASFLHQARSSHRLETDRARATREEVQIAVRREVEPSTTAELHSSSETGTHAELSVDLEGADDRAAWREVTRSGKYGGDPAPSWLVDDLERERRRLSARGESLLLDDPDPQGHFVAYSDQEVSRETARQAAESRLNEKIALWVLWKLKERLPHLRVRDELPLARSLIEESASRVYDVGQQHLQSAELEYAGQRMYRAAIQARVAPATIDELVERLGRRLEDRLIAKTRQRHLSFWITLVGALAGFVLFALYVILNANTKGYFAWPLRLVAGASLLAVGAVVYYLLRNLEP